MLLELNMFHTCAIAVLVLLVGSFVKKGIYVLQKFCIPTPVVGGLILTLITLFGHNTGLLEIKFNFVLSDFFMLAFYSSIGFTASYKLLKKGGVKVIKYLIASIIVVTFQNAIGAAISKFMGLNPLLGLATGSIPMTGGHGTSAAFAPILEKAGLQGATTISLAAATFGLVAGSLIGGPVAKYLIEKNKLKANVEASETLKDSAESLEAAALEEEMREKNIFPAVCQLLLAMSLGNIISDLLAKVGLTFPASVGGMLASAIFVNISDYWSKLKIRQTEIRIMGNISLLLFLAMSMMSLKLWQLADLAIPMIILLIAQTVFMVLAAVYLTFNMMGRDYEAAVMASGHCGFGLGAVPTAMANMKTIEEKYGPAKEAFFIVPLVGSLFINFFNSVVITFFINILS